MKTILRFLALTFIILNSNLGYGGWLDDWDSIGSNKSYADSADGKRLLNCQALNKRFEDRIKICEQHQSQRDEYIRMNAENLRLCGKKQKEDKQICEGQNNNSLSALASAETKKQQLQARYDEMVSKSKTREERLDSDLPQYKRSFDQLGADIVALEKAVDDMKNKTKDVHAILLRKSEIEAMKNKLPLMKEQLNNLSTRASAVSDDLCERDKLHATASLSSCENSLQTLRDKSNTLEQKKAEAERLLNICAEKKDRCDEKIEQSKNCIVEKNEISKKLEFDRKIWQIRETSLKEYIVKTRAFINSQPIPTNPIRKPGSGG